MHCAHAGDMSKSVEAALAELSEGGTAGGSAVPAVQVSQTGKLIVPSMPWNRLKFIMSEVCPFPFTHALPLPSLSATPILTLPDPDPLLILASPTDLPRRAMPSSHSHSHSPYLTHSHLSPFSFSRRSTARTRATCTTSRPSRPSSTTGSRPTRCARTTRYRNVRPSILLCFLCPPPSASEHQCLN